jgi:acid phosphatase (class A)
MLRFFLCALTAGVLATSAAAQGQVPPSFHFLKSGQIDLAKALPAPPGPNSRAQSRDMAVSLAWQRRRTPAMIALAQADQDRSVFRFAVILGDSFAKDRLPLAARFFEDVAEDEGLVGAAAKSHWNRPRPFVASTAVHPCVDQPPTNSYPSNHAAVGMLYAEILARMLPERRRALLARARQYALDRVVCGVHYLSDVEAGKRAGAIEAEAMFHNGAFVAAFAAAKREVRSALAANR